jgi:hypothetical protein
LFDAPQAVGFLRDIRRSHKFRLTRPSAVAGAFPPFDNPAQVHVDQKLGLGSFIPSVAFICKRSRRPLSIWPCIAPAGFDLISFETKDVHDLGIAHRATYRKQELSLSSRSAN